jgi:hypothetical protein
VLKDLGASKPAPHVYRGFLGPIHIDEETGVLQCASGGHHGHLCRACHLNLILLGDPVAGLEVDPGEQYVCSQLGGARSNQPNRGLSETKSLENF